MSARSKFVQIGRGLIILDPQTMPVNLGYSSREDAPEQSFPCLAYDGHNVLPTALGYQSYFGENNRLNIGTLTNYHVQHVFQYQSVNMRTLSVALMEEGVAVANGSEGDEGFQWQLVIDKTADFVEGVRRLWTYCVIGNKLYFYMQGGAVFYGMVNGAEYQETSIPAVIEGASITQLWYNEVSQTGILAYKPNFINMDGQLGIFKASNRLGFWDSENAVSWSSATQIYDFVPSTTTFAGVTTFTDVVGRIVAIKQHGSGFIIYATRSITLVSPISGSPEKWAGRAIFSDVGVVFDIQVVIAQPDTIHYAISSAGLLRISNGAPEVIETEVMDYIRNNNAIYAISFIDSRYIFLHVTNEFDSSVPETDIVLIPDSVGGQYYFPKPIPPTDDPSVDLQAMLNAMLASQQAEFTDVQEPIPDVLPPKDNEALLPCWDMFLLDTNFTADAIPSRDAFDPVESIESAVLASTYQRSDIYTPPSYGITYKDKAETDAYYYDTPRDAFDVGAVEFIDKYLEATGKIIELQGISEQAHQILGETVRDDLFFMKYKAICAPINLPLGVQSFPGTDKILDVRLRNQITTFDTRITDCGVEVFTHLATRRTQLSILNQSEKVSNLFTRMSLGFFFQDGELLQSFKGYTMGGDRYYFGATSTDSELFARAAWQDSSPPGLDWSSRVGISLDINVNDGVVIDQWFLNLAVDSEAPGNKATTYYFQEEDGGDSGSWRPIMFPDNALVFATMSGIKASMAVNSNTASLDPGPMDDICGTEEVNYNEGAYNVFTSYPMGASQGTYTKRTDLFGGKATTSDPGNPLCVPVGISTTNTTARIGTFGLMIINLGFSGRTPEQVYQAFLNDPRVNVEDWTEAQLAEVQSTILGLMTDCPKIVELNSFTTRYDRTVEEVAEEETTLFRAEVSGYGYYPKGGFSFRKTHSRSIFKPCNYAGSPELYNGVPGLDPTGVEKELPGGSGILDPIRPPYQWDYPPLPVLPPNYVVFQEGTFAPYYPLFREAVVLDTQLGKWGRYNNNHKLVYSLFPVNRVDQTIIPQQAGIMRAGSLTPMMECSIFTHENNNSRITYGKIGDYRLGWTKATKTVAQFAYPAQAYIIVETSLNGDEVDLNLSQATDVPMLRRVELPFTLAGKWFNIRLEGQFNLVGLSLESEARSRR